MTTLMSGRPLVNCAKAAAATAAWVQVHWPVVRAKGLELEIPKSSTQSTRNVKTSQGVKSKARSMVAHYRSMDQAQPSRVAKHEVETVI